MFAPVPSQELDKLEHLQQYFSYIVAVSFIGDGNQTTRRNHWPVAVTNKLYHIMLYTLPWLRFELPTSVVIGTDCIGSCKSNYHTIMTMMALRGQGGTCVVLYVDETAYLFVKIERSLISSIPTMSKKFEWLVQSKIKLLYKKTNGGHVL